MIKIKTDYFVVCSMQGEHMLYVERSEDGRIISLHAQSTPLITEKKAVLDDEVLEFLHGNMSRDTLKQLLSSTDSGTVRILEDLIDLLVKKNLINFTELPDHAQQRIWERKHLREELESQELLVHDIL